MKNVIAYNGLEYFSKSHKLLIRIYIAYLFFIPGVSMFAQDYYFEASAGWTKATFLFIIFIHLGFVMNNFQVPATSLRTLFLIIRLPLELVIFSFWQDWSFEMVLASFYAFEVIGFALGLTIGTIFRKAGVTLVHRLFSITLAAGITYCSLLRFSGVFSELFSSLEAIWMIYVVLILTILLAALPYAKMFITGQDGKGLNMGSSILITRLGPYLGTAILINIAMMLLGLNL